MTKFASAFTAAALSLAVASPALAGWDRTQVNDPAYSRSYDRQLELAAERLTPVPVDQSYGSAVATSESFGGIPSATNDAVGLELDPAGRINSPHGN